jgi:hypothetical protein
MMYTVLIHLVPWRDTILGLRVHKSNTDRLKAVQDRAKHRREALSSEPNQLLPPIQTPPILPKIIVPAQKPPPPIRVPLPQKRSSVPIILPLEQKPPPPIRVPFPQKRSSVPIILPLAQKPLISHPTQRPPPLLSIRGPVPNLK